MDIAVDRLNALSGMTPDLRVQLARCNPTFLQMELLTTADEVRMFVHEVPSHLRTMDADTLARFAMLHPTREQMSILCTADAVRAFVHLREGGGGVSAPPATNPIGVLQERVVPAVPTYAYVVDGSGEFICTCTVNHMQTRGRGATKRASKVDAATAMLERIPSTQAPRNNG